MNPETAINIAMVEYTEAGHSITSPATNDPDGYVYFNNKRYFRTPYPGWGKVQEYSPAWGYWCDITDVTVTKFVNKVLTYLPDAL